MKRLVIFDLDGTLLDTITDLALSCNHALEACGYPLPPMHLYRTFVGNGIDKLLERSLPPEAKSEQQVGELRSHFQPYYDLHSCVHTAPYAGVMELLEQLSQRGIMLAVASNKYQSATQELVQHFFGSTPWRIVLGQREGVPRKPDPTIVYDILQHCGVEADETLYVGDSDTDMETAYRAGVQSVGVSWGFRPVSDLIAHHAGTIVHQASEILPLVDGE